jgi:hypothetical protein
VALGWGEPCVPWWGPASFRHRPWWGGWNGPRVVNNVVINKTTVVNVQEINVYRNAGVRNAMVVVHENQFGRGPIKATRVPQADEKNFHPVRTAPQVAATPASLAPRETRGVRPPERVMERSVVATRPPQPRPESASGVERKTGTAPVPTPAPRIVGSPQPRGTTPTLERAPFGQSKVERHTTDRAQAPSPPKVERQRGPEAASKEIPSPSPKAPASQQRESQAAGPSRHPGVGPAQAPSPPKAERQGRPQAATKETPAPSPKAPAAMQRQPQQAGPSSAASRPSGRPAEATRPPERTLPGEPANRLSPNRAETKPQQGAQRKESKRPVKQPEGTPEDTQQQRPQK